MSGGILVRIPNLDRLMMPFSPFDNNNISKTIDMRLKYVRKKKGSSPALTKNPFLNHCIICTVIEQFFMFLDGKMKNLGDAWHTQALYLASNIVHMVHNPNQFSIKDFFVMLLELQKRVDSPELSPLLMEPGMDQIIARLNYMMNFEDQIVTWDYYALWPEDVEC